MNCKRFAAAGLAAAMLLGLSACGDKTAKMPEADAVVMTVNGADVTAKDYAEYMYNAHANVQAYMQYQGMDEASYIEQTGADAYTSMIRAQAEYSIVLDKVLENEMADNNLELTDDDKSLMEMYTSYGMDESYIRQQLELQKLQNFYEEAANVSDEEIQKNFQENYMRCKHILIKTIDDNGNDLENQDELEQKAKDLAARAKNGEDFDALIKEYGEDPGMESSPDGYVFTEGTMVQEFYDGTKALAEEEISDPIKSSYGWHIIERLPLRESDLDNVKSSIISAIVDYTGILDGKVREADYKVDDSAKAITYENCVTFLPEKQKADESTDAASSAASSAATSAASSAK